MTLGEFTKYKDERFRENGFGTCEDLAMRVQDAPGPNETFDLMDGFTSESADQHLF